MFGSATKHNFPFRCDYFWKVLTLSTLHSTFTCVLFSYRNKAIGDDWAGHNSEMLSCAATFIRLKSSPDVILGGTDCKGSERK